MIKIAPRSRALLALFALALVPMLLSAACQLPWPTQPTIVITNTNTATAGTQPAPGASASPTNPACGTPSHVAIGGCAQGVRVGELCTLSLTPFLGPGAESPKVCDDARAVEWSSGAVCRVLATGPNPKYVPDLQGVSPGVCTVFATVDGVRSAELSVEIRK